MTTTQRRSRSRWGALVGAGAAVLLAGCGATAPAGTAPDASAVVVDDPAIPVPQLAQEQVEGTGPFAPSTGSGGPCNRGFIADPAGSFEGEPSAGDALVRWLEGPRGNPEADPDVVPVEVPADGWVAEQAPDTGPAQQEWQRRSFTSGQWRVTAIQSSNGSWMVNELGCTTW